MNGGHDYLLLPLAFLALLLVYACMYPVIRVLGRLGLNRSWAILFMLGPLGWVIGTYFIAFCRWPAVDKREP